MTQKFFLFVFAVLFSFSLHANPFCPQSLEKIPIQQGGRIKPLSVHAQETIKFLTGKTRRADKTAITLYCELSRTFLDGTSPLLEVPIQHTRLKTFLKTEKISFESLLGRQEEILFEYRQQGENSSYKKSLEHLLQQLQFYEEIRAGENWVIPDKQNNEWIWVPLSGVFQPQTGNSPDLFVKNLEERAHLFSGTHGTSHLLELKYSKLKLHLWALLITGAALMTLAVPKTAQTGILLAFLTLITQGILLFFRILISGRAPITNMYETVLFSGFGGLVLSMILFLFNRKKIFVSVGLMYNACTLLMINFAQDMLPSSINPLVPVLRDNFWLSTHVTIIILSYGALALSWVLANTVLIQQRFFGLSKSQITEYSQLIYTLIKFGTVFLALGIILGGIWADYSWGRFWGWDPKETWSLIALCIYIAILHGRYTSWIPHDRFIPLVAAAFMSIMMAWFGVNYILASGLHSYGFSQGGALFLAIFFSAQILLLFLGLRNRLKKNT